MSDALASYNKLPQHGYQHKFVVHKKEFVKSDKRDVHTQNIEIRNRWTKDTIKSYGTDRRLNSYCAEYSYRFHNLLHTVYCQVVIDLATLRRTCNLDCMFKTVVNV